MTKFIVGLDCMVGVGDPLVMSAPGVEGGRGHMRAGYLPSLPCKSIHV